MPDEKIHKHAAEPPVMPMKRSPFPVFQLHFTIPELIVFLIETIDLLDFKDRSFQMFKPTNKVYQRIRKTWEA